MARVSADVVVLGTRRKDKLEAIVRRASCPQQLVFRARIVLLAACGESNQAIAAALGTTVGTARKWRRRYVREGMPADDPVPCQISCHGADLACRGAVRPLVGTR
jgi:hypothetical protein